MASRRLADGNEASVGELIITRSNDRRLRASATDWVKNGDRWTVLALHDPADGGGLTVQHTRHGRTVRLPAAYVEAATELGYATTIHTAQDVTADTMHGLTAGEESRQQLYTMLTRGRAENHVYLQVVGDGDPHSLIHPETTHPQTPVDLLERMLAHDDTPRSATTLAREAAAPTTRLGQATTRYLDSLHLAAEQHLEQTRPGLIAALDQASRSKTTENASAELSGLAGLSEASAWPTLRAHLLLLAAGGADPLQALAEAAAEGELDTAGDRAAVLDWRLDATGLRTTTGTAGPPQPLPWLPAVPADLAADPHWGAYLNARAGLVADLADQVRTTAEKASPGSGIGVGALPVWARNGLRPDPRGLADVEVWRAAMRVDPADRRPTGPAQQATAAATYQRRLNRRLTGDHTPALAEWNHLLTRLAPTAASDEFAPLLAQRLAAMTRAGIRADRLVHAAAAAGPLPDEHAAAALWWRMSRHLTPAVAAQIDDQVTTRNHQLTTTWVPRLPDILGHDQAQQVQASTWWPALVTNLDHALQRGWQLEDLLTAARPTAGDQPSDAHDDVEECLALVWRTSIALDPVPQDPDGPQSPLSHAEAAGELEEPPEDLWEGVDPADYADRYLADQPAFEPAPRPSSDPASGTEDPTGATTTPAPPAPADRGADHGADRGAGPHTVETALVLAGMIRDAGRPAPIEPTETDVRRMLTRAHAWDTSPITRERMLAVNDLAAGYYQTQLPGSWAQQHLLDRFRVDLTGHQTIRPGYAPMGWTTLVDHLRRHGVTDAEMLATGLASTARTGRLIDRFRDRLVFPITHPARHQPHYPDRHQADEPRRPPGSEVLGFVGRRHPHLSDHDQHAGPKYLNTGETLLFHKAAQLFGVDHADVGASAQGPTPVIVEGPMDAIAVTVSTAGSHVGVAPLGTCLTEEQAAQLARITHQRAETDTGQWRDPIVATDADLAGQVAAERAYWMLTPHGFDPGHARLPAGYDPADLLALRGPAALAGPLALNTPLGQRLLAERLNHLPADQAGPQAATVLAARPGHTWDAAAQTISDHTGQPVIDIQRSLLDAVRTWDADPRKAAATQLTTTQQVRERMDAAAQISPAQRWSRLADQLDPRLTSEQDCQSPPSSSTRPPNKATTSPPPSVGCSPTGR